MKDKYLDNRLDCKIQYLESLGFIKGTDKASGRCLRILNWIHEEYFRNNVRPTLLPEKLPDDWVFPAPPVCTTQWTEKDWVIYAAPYNNR